MDILDTFALELPCAQCGGTYRLPLKNVALSQQMMHVGCPVHDERECPPAFEGPLFDEAALQELQKAWSHVEAQARKAGLRLVLEASPHPHP